MTRKLRAPESPDEIAEDLADADDAPAKRRPWGPDVDEHLRSLVHVYGIKSWAQIATQLHNRNGKQCRERWRNHLRPELNKGDWSAQEDIDIWERVQEMGTKWAQVRSALLYPESPLQGPCGVCRARPTNARARPHADLRDLHATAHR